jgi:putative hydrolase of the HAD superfamily
MMIEVYRDHEPAIQLFPDADRALERVARAGRNLALITDGYRAVQARKIRALGLETRIGCRIITDELGRSYWKPSPEPFRRVMAAYHGSSSGYVYVADNPRKDFIGCRQLGWRSVRMRRPGGEHATYMAANEEEADMEVADCDLLMEYLGLD